MKVDLHLHTCYSPDSSSSLESIVERCREIGLDCIAITDHNTIEGALRIRDMAPFPVIISEEIMTSAGEIIGYFLTQPVPKGLTPEETIARIRDQGGLTCLPHPFAHFGRHPLKASYREALISQIDIIEVFNARSFYGNFSQQARDIARQHGLAESAGSDAHSVREMGKAWVEMESFCDATDFKAALLKGRIHAQKNGIVNHLMTAMSTLPKRLSSR